MNVSQFLEEIEAHGDRPLLFEYKSGEVVQGGYHVTEIKNASYETIDCGNSLHTWKEVVVQVWVPEEASAEDPWMPTGKFLKIWNVVDKRLALYRDAEIRIEFGDASNLTSIYHVDGFAATEDGLVAQLAPPRTMCKPREILIEPNEMSAAVVSAVAEASCCGPAERQETVVPLATVAAEKSGSGCC